MVESNCRVSINVLWVTSLLMFSSSVLCGGFQISVQTVPGIGRAAAGYGLVGDDASAIFYNPAAMTLLKDTQIQGGLFYVTTSSEFENQGSTLRILGQTVPTGGANRDGGTDGPIAATYLVTDPAERFRLGLGITTPFGFVTDYKSDWVGRYHALRSELKTIDINPSFAFRLNDYFSIGGGISVQHADATLSRAVFTGLQLPDGFVRVRGKDWGLGYDVGAMYEASQITRFGVGFRSTIEQTFDGIRKLEGVPGLSGTVGAKARLKLPETLYIGAYHQFHPQWALTAGIRWTNWSRFDEIRIRFADSGPDDVTPQNWEDSWTFALGVDYRYNPDWTFRAGYSFDETPVRSKQFRTPRIPDNDNHWLAVGASYTYQENLVLDLGYTHVFYEDAEIENTINLVSSNLAPLGTFSSTLVGDFESASVDVVGAQLRYSF
ncbi:MAG: OmpP1/FadL family transporter [Chromatiales bacterium]